MFDSSVKIKLNCGGKSCSTCGACRDWYFDRDNRDTLKRDNAKCIHENIFAHDLVREEKDQSCYPLGRIICECKDNH